MTRWKISSDFLFLGDLEVRSMWFQVLLESTPLTLYIGIITLIVARVTSVIHNLIKKVTELKTSIKGKRRGDGNIILRAFLLSK